MTTADPTLAELRTALSTPLPTDRLSLSRRHFVQAVAAGVGVSMLPSWLAESAAAAPAAGAARGTVVYVVLDGGNDGLHMVPPVSSGAYHDARGALAWKPSQVLDLGGGRGLHPSLTRLKARFDAGDVAVIDGVGSPDKDLSHFSSMATHQRGGAASAYGLTGWIGRYLDEADAGAYGAIALGDRVPLLVRGRTGAAVTLPRTLDRLPKVRPWAAPMDAAIGRWNQMPTGRGALADAIAGATSSMFETAAVLRPWYPTVPTGGDLVDELRLCACLVNAGIGTRVLTVRHGPYDSHAAQADMHGARMAELDAGIEAFFSTLAAAVADDVTLVCVSEFGRRVAANGGGGTDHGSANVVVAVGRPVVGGFHGTLPSLTSLTAEGNLRHDIDHRSISATILDRVLGVDPDVVLGSDFPRVPFLAAAAPAPPPVRSRTGLPERTVSRPDLAAAVVAHRSIRPAEAEVLRLHRAFLDREADAAEAGTLVSRRAGGESVASIAESLAQESEFVDRYGALADADFVEVLHEALFGRPPRAGERRELLRGLAAGTIDRTDAVRLLATSAEFEHRYPYTELPGWSARGAERVGVLARSGA